MNSQRSTYEELLQLMDLASEHGLYSAAYYLAQVMPDEPVNEVVYDVAPIHSWFGLTYASYLVVPRTILQSMPTRLQQRFVACLNQMNDMFGKYIEHNNYTVQLRDGHGRFVKDALADYSRGRTTLAPIEPTTGLPSLLTPAVIPRADATKPPTGKRPAGFT